MTYTYIYCMCAVIISADFALTCCATADIDAEACADAAHELSYMLEQMLMCAAWVLRICAVFVACSLVLQVMLGYAFTRQYALRQCSLPCVSWQL